MYETPALYSFLLFSLAAILVLIGILLCLVKPKVALALLICVILVQDNTLYLSGEGQLLFSALDLFDELILVVLTLSWLMRTLLIDRGFRKTPVDKWVMLFILYYLLSALFHRVALANAVIGFRDTLFYVLLFYVLVQFSFSEEYLMLLLKIVFGVAVLNLMVLLGQWLAFFLGSGSVFLEDEAVGLMGPSGAHKLGYFAGVLLLIYLGLYSERVYRNRLFILVLLSIVIISSTRAVIFYIPLAVTLLYGPRIIRSRRMLRNWIGTLVSFTVCLAVYLSLPGASQATLSPQTLLSQQLRSHVGDRMSRTGLLAYTWEHLSSQGLLLWGMGPGWYIGKTASRLGSPSFADLPQNVDTTLSQLALTLGEYGVVGSVLVVVVYLSLLRFMYQLNQTASSSLLRGLAAANIGMLAIFSISALSNNVFEIQQVAFLPWLLAGITLSLVRQSRQNNPESLQPVGSFQGGTT